MKLLTVGIAAGALALWTAAPAYAQSSGSDFDSVLLNVATSGAQEGPEPTEVDGVEGPEDPNDLGPDVNHEFEGEEVGENGNGVEGAGGGL